MTYIDDESWEQLLVAQKDVYSVSAFGKVQCGFPVRNSAFRRRNKWPLWSAEGKVSILHMQYPSGKKTINLRSSDEKLNRAVMRCIVVATRGFDMACLI
jgi:hypothetical protein